MTLEELYVELGNLMEDGHGDREVTLSVIRTEGVSGSTDVLVIPGTGDNADGVVIRQFRQAK